MNLSRIFSEFFESEKTGGLLLLACTFLSLFLANSSLSAAYLHFWHRSLDLSFFTIALDHTLEYWINDGLMTVFFLLVGLEIERELYDGELSDLRAAVLPIGAALGGMIVPAFFHWILNFGTVTQAGIGIPMATDIAFALGALSLLGNRIPPSLKVFLAALAIIDDLGAVIIIALFYTSHLSFPHLGAMALILLVLIILNRLKVKNLLFYIVPGIIMWFFMQKSGVHATAEGILLAFVVPFDKDKGRCPSYRLQRILHKPVSFLILPLFALANTGIVLTSSWYLSLTENNSLGILAGLILGKPLGIILASFLIVKTGWVHLPEDLTFRHLAGIGILAGIGFTMSIFITNLAFKDPILTLDSKIAILAASAVSGLLGYLWLLLGTKPGRSASDSLLEEN
jgi:Na+:H+ antiporter, NhaA family